MTNAVINKLFKKMTIEEKIGQMMQLSADFFQGGQAVITGPMKNHNIPLGTIYNAGSVLGVSGAKKIHDIQSNYLAHSRLKIPLLFMADVVHGYKTIFPIPLALGASFDPDVVKKASHVAAAESAAGGVDVTFAPMVDLVRDPRWGRVMESTGEDPYLNGVMAKASVKGFQGENGLTNHNIAACVKHFAAYGAPEAGREYNTVDISEWRFREQYLPAYAKAIESQALLVMTSFNTLFGIPATANQYLLRKILRKELKFNGLLISDWDAIGELIAHGVAGNLKQAADLALKAGVDVDMMSFAYASYLKQASVLDDQTLKLIDESVLRILELKTKLGLFKDPYRGISEKREKVEIQSKYNLQTAQKAAEESMVLLKNKDDLLPLLNNEKIFVVGPAADTGDILGSWSWQGDPVKTEHFLTAIKKHFSDVSFAPGCGYHFGNKRLLQDAFKSAASADVIVAILGLAANESGEATSMVNIQLPVQQIQLLEQLAKLGKPIVSVIVTGRPLDLREVVNFSNAILLTWFPGSKGAEALAKILGGQISPSGKLPMTFPRTVGQIPIYYNAYNTGRPLSHTSKDDKNKYLSKYIDSPTAPLYPFGYGLSYSKFRIDKITLSSAILTEKKAVILTVNLSNLGNIKAKTVVQCYFHQLVGEMVCPIKQLFAFKKVMIPAHQSIQVSFTLNFRQFSSVHSNLKSEMDQGKYNIMVGLDSVHVQTVELIYKI